MKDDWGRIVAFDFGASSFLPVCFIKMALREGDRFTQLVAKHVQLPGSSRLNALLTAHYALVPFNTNNIGEQISLLSFIFLASRSLARRLSSMYCTGVPSNLKTRVK